MFITTHTAQTHTESGEPREVVIFTVPVSKELLTDTADSTWPRADVAYDAARMLERAVEEY